MLREPWMTIGPGPAIDPESVTEAKLKPPAETSNPADTWRQELERAELHDRVDLDEAVRLEAQRDADLEPAAELQRVRRDREVALGADVDDRHGVVEREADAAQRRDPRGLGIEAREEAADRGHDIADGAPADAHRRIAVDLEDAEDVAVDEAGVDRDELLDRVDDPQDVEAQVEDERQAGDARPGHAEDRRPCRSGSRR